MYQITPEWRDRAEELSRLWESYTQNNATVPVGVSD
jgi:hypothetical protein